jgi:hypothetical protein
MREIEMGIRKLDIATFSDKIKYVPIGKLDCNIINFISKQKPELKDRLSSDKDILFWSDRVKYTEKHRKDFSSSEEFDKCLEDIPDIIQNPDYISINPNDDSICFIRKYTKYVTVAVRISGDGKMGYRTMYPLRDSQLQNYIENNRAWKYKEIT